MVVAMPEVAAVGYVLLLTVGAVVCACGSVVAVPEVPVALLVLVM